VERRAGFLLGLFFDPEDGSDMLTFNGLHGVISQNIILFIFSRASYVGVLISLWLFLLPIFLFAAQPKEFFLDDEVISVWSSGGNMYIHFFNPVASCFRDNAKDLSAPPSYFVA
jgi:hypothetical protein